MVQELLRKIGLNKYEKDAYLALVRKGSMGAYNLAKVAGVPYGRIYDALEGLKLKGFVEVVPGKPKIFKAVDPESAFEFALREKEANLKKIREDAQSKLKDLNFIKEGKDFAIFEGEAGFFTTLMQRLRSAEKESVSMFALEQRTGRGMTEKLEETGRKVKRRALVSVGDHNRKLVEHLIKKGMNIKNYPVGNFRLNIIDGELTMLSARWPDGKIIGFEVHNKDFAEGMLKMFDALWEKAEPIHAKA
jgi:sugar-specific transcriptional regulator TrmB